LSLVARLYLLVALALLPAVAIQVWNEAAFRAEREAGARGEALRLAQFAAGEVRRLIATGRVILASAAVAPALRARDKAACDELAARLLGEVDGFAGLLAVDAAGGPFCAAGEGAGPAVDPAWLAAPEAQAGFRSAGLPPTAPGGRPVLLLSRPFAAADGGVGGGVVGVTVDLARLRADLARRALPPDGSMTINDHTGLILVRFPSSELEGGRMSAAFDYMLTAQAPGTTEGLGPDGVWRVGGYVPPAAGDGLLVSVALSRDRIMAPVDAATRRGALLIALGAAVAATAVAVGGRRLVQRPVRRLASAFARLARGEAVEPVDLPGGRSELGRLGAAFSTMAATLRAREEALIESEQRFRRAVERAVVPIMFHAEDGEILAVSDGLVAITGYRRERLDRFPAWARLAYGERAPAMAAVVERRFAGERFAPIEREVRTADGRSRIWLFDIGPPQRLGDGRLCLVAILSDVTALHEQAAALRASEERLRLALAAGRMGVWHERLDTGEATWSEAAFRLFGVEPGRFDPAGFRALVHPEDRARLDAGRAAAMERHEDWRDEFRVILPDGGERWLAGRGSYARDAAGEPVAVTGVSWDITERKLAEERQLVLLQELNHRVKNVLAVVQSIATLSLAHAASLQAFRQGFTGRLQALVVAHDALVARRWEGAGLVELVRGILAPYADAGAPAAGDRARVDVPDVTLERAAAQALALALHELATNAAKHGALSRPEGTVTVAAAVAAGALTVTWRERGGPPVLPPAATGFGTVLVTRFLPMQTRGRVDLDWRPEGLVCTIVLPLTPLQPAAAAGRGSQAPAQA
jgi:PAS domain S-box-containing protein